MHDQADELTSEVDCTRAYIRLMSGLKKAGVEAHRDGRGGAITALQSVIAFVDVMPQPKGADCTLGLTKLLAALQDLEDGRASAMLCLSRATGGSPPDSSLRKTVKGAASSAIDILVARSWSLEKACKFVAEQLKRAEVPIGGRSKTPDWQVVRGWRQRLSKLSEFDQERHTREVFRQAFASDLAAAFNEAEVKAVLARGLQALVSGWGEKALE